LAKFKYLIGMRSIKLNNMSAQTLSKKQLGVVKGGECKCGCGCLYANNGGSPTGANMAANAQGGGLRSASNIITVSCDATYDPKTNTGAASFIYL
jgi:natural product precursor